MDFNYKKIMLSLNEDFMRCLKSISYIEDYAQYGHKEDPYDEQNDYETSILIYKLKGIYKKLLMIFESLGFNKIISLLEEDFSKFNGKLAELHYYSEIGELGSEPYGLLNDYYDQIRLLLNINEDEALTKEYEYSRVKAILRSTPKIIRDSKTTPESESDVKKEIRKVLTYFFPDTVAEIPIPKSVKTFKPDIGIRSLNLAIEYKYANNEDEVKTCVSGLLEDIKGYAGSNDWKQFIAVIYMTEAMFSEEQIDSLFKQSELPQNWFIISVHGQGDRKVKKIQHSKAEKNV